MSELALAWLLLGMALLTFLPRLLPLLMADRLRLPTLLREALEYVPLAVLTILVVQTAFIQQGQLNLHWRNPYLLALLLTLVVAVWRRHLLTSMAAGVAGFIVLKWFSL